MGKKGKATSYIVVLVTFKNTAEAKRITTVLLSKRLIACCNLIPVVESSFWWEGKIQKEKEALAIIKTKKSQWDLLLKEIQAHHSYSVPEILAIPLLKGNPRYLQWMKEVVA